MSLFGKIKKAVKKAGKKVAKVVKDVVEENIDAAESAVTAPIKDALDVVEHVVRGTIDILTGDEKGAKREFERARHAAGELGGDVLLGPLDAGALIGSSYLGGLQRLFGIEGEPRPLTKEERALLEPIFSDSVEYDEVEITDGDTGLFGVTNAAVTLGYRIRISSSSGFVPLSKYPHVLVHEMVHVWQFENGGPDYVHDALLSQLTGSSGKTLDMEGNVANAPQGYAFDTDIADGKRWNELNAEQQAHFIEIAYRNAGGMNFADPTTTPMMFDGVDYTGELVNALDWIRSREGSA